MAGRNSYKSIPLKYIVLFWVIVGILLVVVSSVSSCIDKKSEYDPTDMSSAARTFLMRDVNEELAKVYPDAYFVTPTNTYRPDNKKQTYVISGEFYHRVDGKEVKGSFWVSGDYNPGEPWSNVEIRISGGQI